MGYLTDTMTGEDEGRGAGQAGQTGQTTRERDIVRLVEAFATPSAPEAEVVRSLLESEGIAVVVRGMSQSPYRMGATYLLVPADLQDRARRLIDAARADGEAGAFDWSGEDATR